VVPATDGGKEELQLFLARFKPETYVLTPRQDNMSETRPVLPEDIEQKSQVARAESEFRLLSNSISLRARQIHYSGACLSADELPKFFDQLKRIQ
jgi:hypothetical protein